MYSTKHRAINTDSIHIGGYRSYLLLQTNKTMQDSTRDVKSKESAKKKRRTKQRQRQQDSAKSYRRYLGQTPGDGEGQRSLVCCSPWGLQESDTTW